MGTQPGERFLIEGLALDVGAWRWPLDVAGHRVAVCLPEGGRAIFFAQPNLWPVKRTNVPPHVTVPVGVFRQAWGVRSWHLRMPGVGGLFTGQRIECFIQLESLPDRPAIDHPWHRHPAILDHSNSEGEMQMYAAASTRRRPRGQYPALIIVGVQCGHASALILQQRAAEL